MAPAVASRPFAPRFVAPQAPRYAAPAPGYAPPPRRYGGYAAPDYVAPNYGAARHAAPGGLRYGHSVTYIRGPHYVHRRGVARRLASVGALSALAIGLRTYFPYAYVPLAERTCTGVTPDGCELDWAEVPTEDGDLVQQCVAYCPR